jgi:hypothetical protein
MQSSRAPFAVALNQHGFHPEFVAHHFPFEEHNENVGRRMHFWGNRKNKSKMDRCAAVQRRKSIKTGYLGTFARTAVQSLYTQNNPFHSSFHICFLPFPRISTPENYHRATFHGGEIHRPRLGCLSQAPVVCTLRGIASTLRKPSISLPVDKKRPPFSAGAKLPWFSLLRELDWRPDGGVAVGTERASGEWLRGLRAAPHRSWMLHPGVMRHPGPPNCFPSTGCARCWS